jgi:glycosyltransferase involved in cell wall biosynthesis
VTDTLDAAVRAAERRPRSPARHRLGPVPGPRAICLYTPSIDASGMGAHMVDLAAEFAEVAAVSGKAWETSWNRRLLARAAAVGATSLPLPHPRDPAFADTVVAHLAAHPADVFHVHVGFGKEDFDGARAARYAGVPAVVQTQHLPWRIGSHKPRARLFHALEPVDRVIMVSEAQRRTYERIGLPADRIATVPNGVRPRDAGLGPERARAELGLDPEAPVVLTVGRLTVMKGQRHLVNAVPGLAARFPGLQVVLIGHGHLREALERQAADLGVAHVVHLAGHRPEARLLLDAADVFVLPSVNEAMPLALLEAMDAGLPVVATRVFGSAEVVVDGETGLLVPPGDPGALGSALARLLADPRLRRRYAAAGRRRYLEAFTSARMAADTLAVYRRVLTATARALGAGA